MWCKIEQWHKKKTYFWSGKRGKGVSSGTQVVFEDDTLESEVGGSKGGGWVMEGKVERSVPHWGHAHSVAAETCQITESTVEDTWIFTPKHSGWLLQMSKHVLQVWEDGGGLCHAITHRVWKFSSCMLKELQWHTAQLLDSWVYFLLYCC